MKPKPTDSYHHGDLRAALIEAGAEVAARRGVDAIRVAALARTLGVSSGAPFRHFESRDALLVAIAEQAALRQLDAMRRAAADRGPREAQQAMGVAYVRWAVENPGFFRVLSRAESLAGSATLRGQSEALIAQLQAALDPREAPVALRGSAAVLAARALVHGLAAMIVDGLLGDVDPDAAERLATQVTAVLGAGLHSLQGDA